MPPEPPLDDHVDCDLPSGLTLRLEASAAPAGGERADAAARPFPAAPWHAASSDDDEDDDYDDVDAPLDRGASAAAAARALARALAADAARFNAAHAAPPPNTPAEEFLLLASRRAASVCGAGVAALARAAGNPGARERAALLLSLWEGAARVAADAADGLCARAVRWRARSRAADEGGGAVAGPARPAADPRRLPASPTQTSPAARPGRRAGRAGRHGERPASPPPLPDAAVAAIARAESKLQDNLAALTAERERAAAAEEAAATAAATAAARLATLEAERDAALAEAGRRTPRPSAGAGALGAAGEALGGEGTAVAVAVAAAACRGWDPDELVAVLAGDVVVAEEAAVVSEGEGEGAAQPPPADAAPAAADAPAAPSDAAPAADVMAPAPGDASPADPTPPPPPSPPFLLRPPSDSFACLAPALQAGTLTRDAVVAALAARDGAPLVAALADGGGSVAVWVAARVSRGCTTDANALSLTTWLTGTTSSGRAVDAAHFGAAARAPRPALAAALSAAPPSTAARVAAAETEAARLRAELAALRAAAASAPPSPTAAPLAPPPDAPPPLSALEIFIAALDAAGLDEAWKDGFPGLGAGAAVPRVLRAGGRVRNKRPTKRDTERTVKEIWRARIAAGVTAGAGGAELLEFVFAFLQKRVGIPAAVVEAGYNFVYGLWRYRWDADCELCLCILTGQVGGGGERGGGGGAAPVFSSTRPPTRPPPRLHPQVREDVYHQQLALQIDVAGMLAALDRAAHGADAGTLPKPDVRLALRAYFRVGAPGGKTEPRYDALMQALDAVCPGGAVDHASLFAEDREFSQGEFAEAVRDQSLAERLEFFGEVEAALAARAGGASARVTRAHAAAALADVDANLTQAAAWDAANAAFEPGVTAAPQEVVMKRLRAGTGRRMRSTTAGGRVVAAPGSVAPGLVAGASRHGAGALGAPRGGGVKLSREAAAALDAVRGAWLAAPGERRGGAAAPSAGTAAALAAGGGEAASPPASPPAGGAAA